MRWLLVAVQQVSRNVFDVFDEWRRWRQVFGGTGKKSGLQAYYGDLAFRRDFCRFVKEVVAKRFPDEAHVLLALAAHLDSYVPPSDDGSEKPDPPRVAGSPLSPGSRPRLSPGAWIATLVVNYSDMIARLRRGGRLASVGRTASSVLMYQEGSRVKTVQLSLLSAKLLALCDGDRTVAEITRDFCNACPTVLGVDPKTTCHAGLYLLMKQGILRISPAEPSVDVAVVQDGSPARSAVEVQDTLV